MSSNRFSRHLTEAQILEETGVSGAIKLTLTATLVVTAFLLFLSAYIHANEAVKTQGEFLPSQGVQRIHPPEAGIVTEIAAVNGQNVRKGDLLVRLKNAVAEAEGRQVEARLMGLKARAIRLEAFLARLPADFSPIPGKYADLVREQRALLDTQNQVREKSLWVFDSQIQQKKSDIELAKQNLRNMEKSAEVDADLLELKENLGKKNLVSRLSQLESRRAYVDSEGKTRTLRVQIKQNESALEEALAKKSGYERELRNQASQELGGVQNEISQVKTLLERLLDRRNNLDVFAPINGRVQDSRVTTLGGVFNPRDILMEIVPEDDELQLAVNIQPKDIGYVHAGQTVNIQVTSYDFSRFGGVGGRLISISPFTQMDKDGTAFYKGIIKPDRAHIGEAGAGHAIVAGMKAKADIISGNRSILSYILNPLTRPERHGSIFDGFSALGRSLKQLFSPST
ncbi:MAG: HlyD family type I secretion periplasmic adaptor subunit [Magnetococcus sp. YQC-9]